MEQTKKMSYQDRLLRVADAIYDDRDEGIKRETGVVRWRGVAERFDGVPMMCFVTFKHVDGQLLIDTIEMEVDGSTIMLDTSKELLDAPEDTWTEYLVEMFERYFEVKERERRLGEDAVCHALGDLDS